jgi:hypothetical protein
VGSGHALLSQGPTSERLEQNDQNEENAGNPVKTW